MSLIEKQPFGPRLAIEKHRLDNGLTALLLPDRAAPVVAYQTWFHVGSKHERPGRTGIAHLFEHLMFNRTVNLAAGEFDRRLESVGAEANAATWVDWTFYRNSAPASALPLLVELEAERMQHLVLEEEPVESERQVVLNERRQRVDDDVEGFLAEALYQLAFTAHSYGHPTIGWRPDIEAISTEDARVFYRTFYAPNNATVVVVGDFAVEDTLALLQKGYGGIAPADIVLPRPTAEPEQVSERRSVFAKPVLADRAIFAYKAPPQAHDDWLPLVLASEILVGGPSARLYRELIITREAATSILGMVAPFSEPGLLEIFVSMARGESAHVAEELIDAETALLASEPPSDAELQKVKNRLETEHWAQLDTADGKAEALGHHETTSGDHKRLFEVAERVAAVTPADIARVVGTYLRREARTVVIAEPSGEPPQDGDGGDDGDDVLDEGDRA
jgi:zinc protease